MLLHAYEGYENRRTVHHHCQTSDPSIERQYLAGARPDQSADLGPQSAGFQCSGLENRRKGVAIGHGSRRADVRARAVVRLYHWQIVWGS